MENMEKKDTRSSKNGLLLDVQSKNEKSSSGNGTKRLYKMSSLKEITGLYIINNVEWKDENIPTDLKEYLTKLHSLNPKIEWGKSIKFSIPKSADFISDIKYTNLVKEVEFKIGYDIIEKISFC